MVDRFKRYYNKWRGFYLRHEHPILLASFFYGMFWDNLTLRRPDMPYENLVFIWSLFQVFAYVIILGAFYNGKLQNKIGKKIIPFLPMFLQFSFGNLFSGFIVLYMRSGTIFASWPFIVFLAVLFVGNEFFRERYKNLAFQISIFFTAIFTYVVFSLPVLINKIGPNIFLLSGGVAIFIVAVLCFVLFLVIPQKLKENLKKISLSVLGIFAVFQVLYFTNIIPPIPLMLRDSGIYHSVESNVSNGYLYEVSFEPASKYLFFKDQSNVFHLTTSNTIYCYGAIFSPADLNVKMIHKWSYYNNEIKKWVEAAKIPFNVVGGRVKGYRGYTYITNAKPGEWRVDITTEKGQVLGRRSFIVVESQSPPILETKLK